MHPKNSHFKTASKLILKQFVKKVWERRFHAFPPHHTPGYSCLLTLQTACF